METIVLARHICPDQPARRRNAPARQPAVAAWVKSFEFLLPAGKNPAIALAMAFGDHALAERQTIALIAHDRMKDDMAAFARRHRDVLSGYDIVATGTTGGRILDAAPDLVVTRMKSGPLGGDQQIGAMIAEGKVTMLLFFTDPLTPMPHDVDVKALTRLATVYDIPMALNQATAELLIVRNKQ
jgi:methylglyoxal synthase